MKFSNHTFDFFLKVMMIFPCPILLEIAVCCNSSSFPFLKTCIFALIYPNLYLKQFRLLCMRV